MNRNDYIGYDKKDELQHHGILGQKWGIRRFQNKDGSLTNAGKKHRSSNSSSNSDVMKARKKMQKAQKKAKVAEYKRQTKELEAQTKAAKKASKIVNNPSRKQIKNMSDQQLMSNYNRIKTENDYRRELSNNKSTVNKVLAEIGTKTLINVGTQVASTGATMIGNKALNYVLNEHNKTLGESKISDEAVKAMYNEYKFYTNNKKKS